MLLLMMLLDTFDATAIAAIRIGVVSVVVAAVAAVSVVVAVVARDVVAAASAFCDLVEGFCCCCCLKQHLK